MGGGKVNQNDKKKMVDGLEQMEINLCRWFFVY